MLRMIIYRMYIDAANGAVTHAAISCYSLLHSLLHGIVEKTSHTIFTTFKKENFDVLFVFHNHSVLF